MQPTLCTRCKKRVAVVFISKIEKGETVNEGLCLKCAKELGLPQVNDMMRRMGITDEDLDMISDEMMQAFGGAESMEGPVACTGAHILILHNAEYCLMCSIILLYVNESISVLPPQHN